MSPKALLNPILEDDLLTRGLGDEEARLMIDWLVEQAEFAHDRLGASAVKQVQLMCRRARALSRFVSLWCHHHSHAAACQLAATERFPWPLPAYELDPFDLMSDILAYEEDEIQQRIELMSRE